MWKKEVLHGSFRRREAEAEPGEDVEGEGQDLEGQEHHDEVGGRGDQAHARQGEQQQRVELAPALAGPLEVVEAVDDGDGSDGEQDQPGDHGELVGGDHPPQDVRGAVPAPQQQAGHGCAEDRGERSQEERPLVDVLDHGHGDEED
jgi:hypothetical protein